MSGILQQLVTFVVKALTPQTLGKQTTLSQETQEALSQPLTAVATQQEETSLLFDMDLPEDWAKKVDDLEKSWKGNLYDYSCKLCGVKITTTYILTLPFHCPDHKVLLQPVQVYPEVQ